MKWRMANGQYIKVTDMSDSHLKNTIKYLARNPYLFAIGGSGIDVEDMWFETNEMEHQMWTKALNKELERRGL